jgi:phosphotransacetylase
LLRRGDKNYPPRPGGGEGGIQSVGRLRSKNKIEVRGWTAVENRRSGQLRAYCQYIQAFYELRQRNGVALKDASKLIREPNIFGSMMLKMQDADAFISGLTYDYPEVIRPALQIHHTHPGASRAAGVYIMIVGNRTYLFTDATVNIDPTAEDLAEIACLSAISHASWD